MPTAGEQFEQRIMDMPAEEVQRLLNKLGWTSAQAPAAGQDKWKQSWAKKLLEPECEQRYLVALERLKIPTDDVARVQRETESIDLSRKALAVSTSTRRIAIWTLIVAILTLVASAIGLIV